MTDRLPVFRVNGALFSEQHTNPATVTRIQISKIATTGEGIMGHPIRESQDHPDLTGLTLAKTPIRWAVIDRQKEGTREYLGVVMALVDGKTINQLLLSNATFKGLGLDTPDIRKDWAAIDEDTPDMQARKGRHQGMGLPWHVVARDKAFFRSLIGRDVMPYESGISRREPRTMVLSVMRWINGPEGRSFIYDLPCEGNYPEIIARILSDKPNFLPHLNIPQCFNPTVAIWTIGHISTDVRKNWQIRSGYRQEDIARLNGPTQAGVQTLRYDAPEPRWTRRQDMLLRGNFIRNAEIMLAA